MFNLKVIISVAFLTFCTYALALMSYASRGSKYMRAPKMKFCFSSQLQRSSWAGISLIMLKKIHICDSIMAFKSRVYNIQILWPCSVCQDSSICWSKAGECQLKLSAYAKIYIFTFVGKKNLLWKGWKWDMYILEDKIWLVWTCKLSDFVLCLGASRSKCCFIQIER